MALHRRIARRRHLLHAHDRIMNHRLHEDMRALHARQDAYMEQYVHAETILATVLCRRPGDEPADGRQVLAQHRREGISAVALVERLRKKAESMEAEWLTATAGRQPEPLNTSGLRAYLSRWAVEAAAGMLGVMVRGD